MCLIYFFQNYKAKFTVGKNKQEFITSIFRVGEVNGSDQSPQKINFVHLWAKGHCKYLTL